MTDFPKVIKDVGDIDINEDGYTIEHFKTGLGYDFIDSLEEAEELLADIDREYKAGDSQSRLDDALMIEALAREFEKADTKCYDWTDEQFEIWWTKDDDAARSRRKQRARAQIAVEFLKYKS